MEEVHCLGLAVGFGVGTLQRFISTTTIKDHRMGLHVLVTQWRNKMRVLMPKAFGKACGCQGHAVPMLGQQDSKTPSMRLSTSSPIQPSDVVATFDFAAYYSHGCAEVLKWGDIVRSHGRMKHACRFLLARAVLHKTFQGEGAPLIWGVFGGDKSALTIAHRSSFQQLGIAHLLAVSGYHVGLMSALVESPKPMA